jgi:hypothetical protein
MPMEVSSSEALMATALNVAEAAESAIQDGEPVRAPLAHMFIEGYILGAGTVEARTVAEGAIYLLHHEAGQNSSESPQ